MVVTRPGTELRADEVFRETGRRVGCHFGTMIEVPRAALLAHELAEEAEFFSFGTNDLTQTTLGMSRDDAGTFLPAYVDAQVSRQPRRRCAGGTETLPHRARRACATERAPVQKSNTSTRRVRGFAPRSSVRVGSVRVLCSLGTADQES